MTRYLRLLGLIGIASLAFFIAPTVVSAQTPVQDQYQPAPDADTDPDADSGTDPADDAGDEADEAVDVQAADSSGKLPFTGGSVPLIALLGLALLTAGLIGTAATRKRRTSGSQ